MPGALKCIALVTVAHEGKRFKEHHPNYGGKFF